MALISNPDNPISPQGVLVLATVFTGVMWILAGTRFWVLRHYKFRRFSPRWISDLAVLMIVIFMTVSLGLLFYVYHLVLEMQVLDLKLHELETQEEHHKFRRSDSNLSGGDQNNLEAALNEQWTEVILKIMKCSLAWRLFCTTALWLVKFSIAMVYVELLDTLSRKLRWMVYMALTVIVSTFLVVIVLFAYGMPSENWGEEKQSQLPIVTEYFYGAANIFTDLQVLLLALWALSAARLPQSKLYAVSLLLFMGFVTISLATARAIMYDEHIRSDTALHQSVDIIGLIEPLVASWLACLPALRVLLRMRRKSRDEEGITRLRRSRDEEGDIRLRMQMQCGQHDPIQIRSQTSSQNGEVDRIMGLGDIARYESIDSNSIGIAITGSPALDPRHQQHLPESASTPAPPTACPDELELDSKIRFSRCASRASGGNHSYADVADVVDAYTEAYTSEEDETPPFSANTTTPLGAEFEKEKKAAKKKSKKNEKL